MKPEMTQLLPILKRVPLFADLNDSALTVLAQVSHVKSIPSGSVLFCQGDDAQAAYILCSGVIAIVLNTPDGRELVINEMRAGDCFGELAFLSGGTRSAGAIARAASQLVVIPREEFLAELKAEPALMLHLIETLAKRLRSSTERESALAFLDATARLARTLLELERAGRAPGDVEISQEELAQRIGVTRQTAARILGEWRRNDWIETRRGKIIVSDRAALRYIAHEE
ncbi:MAG: Crp/Fnr family transcriptional regulator [Chloroflexi bacterium]|nr:Crp/Fnr family transcriptional regulator [Chloroflexota bacterium]